MKTLLFCTSVMLTLCLCLLPVFDNAYGQFQIAGFSIQPAPGENDTMLPSRLPNGNGANQTKALRVNLTTVGASPSEQIPITITTDAVDGTGGHVQAHHNARTGTPQGVVINLDGVVNPTNGNMNFGLWLGGDQITWSFNTTFTAPEPSGDHNITATVQGATALTIIHVRVDNLVQLQEQFRVHWVGGTNPHPNANSHYGVQAFVDALEGDIADDWFGWFWNHGDPDDFGDNDENLDLWVNDISLQWGGIFDISGAWRIPHRTHREGKDADIWVWKNTHGGNTHAGIPIGLTVDGVVSGDYEEDFEDIVQDIRPTATAERHGTTYNSVHIHIDW